VQFVSDGVVRARARELYALALVDADWVPDEVCARLGWTSGELAGALDVLAGLGLAERFATAASGWSVHSPATAMAQLMENSQQHTQDLLATVSRAHTALVQVASEFQPVHIRQLAEARIEVAVQPAQVSAILDEAAFTSTSELLSMHPGRLPAARLSGGDERNRMILRRGAKMRSIHLTSAAAIPYVRAHLKELVNEGAEVRTATSLPMRLIIVDRTLAIVPTFDPDSETDDVTTDASPPAMVLRSPAMVGVLRQVFEHIWASSSDLFAEDGGGIPASGGPRVREIIRLLASGLTDEAIGRKLGLSDRTVRRTVAELMQQIGAESRFQAGVKMVRLGWLNDEEPLVASTPGDHV
jgi:DNA-binding CsgD family transcriptional regulator